MKKISLFFAAIVLSTALWAQMPAKFGIKGGLNIATLTGENNTSSRIGYHIGALAHIHLDPQWALQPEVVYSNQGTKYTISDGSHQLSLNYINIPLQLQYMFDNGFRVQTGPQLGFLVGVKDKLDGEETGFFSTDDYKAIDFSWSIGLGYLTYSGFGVDARYNLGVNNINDYGAKNRKNSVVQLGVFYLFDNSHKAKSR